MADSVRDLRRTLERERTSRGQETADVATTSSAPSLMPLILVAGFAVVVAVIVLRNRNTSSAADSSDPLFQLF